jgi:hypothetical protein
VVSVGVYGNKIFDDVYSAVYGDCPFIYKHGNNSGNLYVGRSNETYLLMRLYIQFKRACGIGT